MMLLLCVLGWSAISVAVPVVPIVSVASDPSIPGIDQETCATVATAGVLPLVTASSESSGVTTTLNNPMTTTGSSSSSIESGGGDTRAILEIVNRHNHYRRLFGVPDIAWDAALAARALTTSQHLANKQCALMHDSTGQNLYAAWGFAPSFTDAIDAWMSEPVQPYVYNHASQIVWSTSLHVGCAMARGASQQYHDCVVITCDYLDVGNVIGQCWNGKVQC